MNKNSQEAGFTLIELLVVVAIIGILANIAYPVLRNQILKAQAVRVISDFKNVRRALIEYYRDNNTYPRDYYPGREPPELKPYLQGKVHWKNAIGGAGVLYDWENWVLPDGRDKHHWTGVRYGLSLTTRNRDLINMISRVYRGPFHYTLGRNYTFVMEATRD